MQNQVEKETLERISEYSAARVTWQRIYITMIKVFMELVDKMVYFKVEKW